VSPLIATPPGTQTPDRRRAGLSVKGRPGSEASFFIVHGYWPENATELPRRIEFMARGIKTIVTTEWADESHKA